MRGRVLGMPELHITTEIMNSATPFSGNHAVATSIRRGKVSPCWEKVFPAMKALYRSAKTATVMGQEVMGSA